jgi:Cu/Zn superoxide dismutase
MKSLPRLFATALLIMVFSGCKDHDFYNVITQKGLPLSAVQETTQNSSPATGTADVSYDKTTKMLTYTVTWNNLTGIPTGAHIHGTAARGSNAAVQDNFFSLIPKTTSGTFTNSVPVDGVKIKEDDLLNGLYYFNFHTPANLGGEIRGQIEFYDQSFIVSRKGLPLSGTQEVPPNASTATGTADVTYNKKTKLLSYYITWNNLAANPTGAHIHGPAAKGVNAPVIHNFTTLIPIATSGAFSNSVVIDGVTLKEADLLNGLYYFNIHNPVYPGGEIRGQIEF